jgi:hypothetical protein
MKLTASNGGENDFFGYYNALAISNNRITIIRNWPYYWQVASDGETQDMFSKVAMDGDIIVVGAPLASGASISMGAA